jgi:hypothetical protein
MEAYHFMLCVQPHSALTARELLSVVIEILAYREVEPEHIFATGPVLEIIPAGSRRACLPAR